MAEERSEEIARRAVELRDAFARLRSDVGMPDHDELTAAWSIVTEQRSRVSTDDGSEVSVLQGSLFLLDGLMREALGPRPETTGQ